MRRKRKFKLGQLVMIKPDLKTGYHGNVFWLDNTMKNILGKLFVITYLVRSQGAPFDFAYRVEAVNPADGIVGWQNINYFNLAESMFLPVNTKKVEVEDEDEEKENIFKGRTG